VSPAITIGTRVRVAATGRVGTVDNMVPGDPGFASIRVSFADGHDHLGRPKHVAQWLEPREVEPHDGDDDGALNGDVIDLPLTPVLAHRIARSLNANDLRVLRGIVVDTGGAPVADAVVVESGDRAVSGPDGTFALPLRTAAEGVALPIAASHPRSAQAGTSNVTLPGDLRRSVSIQVQ
jgi:hypothetical protein